MRKVMVLLGVLFMGWPVPAQSDPVITRLKEVPPDHLTEMNGVLYFSANDSVNGSVLWRSDGTRRGTQVVKKFNVEGGDTRAMPEGLVNVDGTLYFCGYEAATGWELWKSDGTGAGTTMVKDIYPGANDGISEYCHIAATGGQIFFGGINYPFTGDRPGSALWKTDGTAANTVMIAEINTIPGAGPPEHLFFMNNTLFFVGNDGTHGWEWWKCEGPAYDSVAMVKDIGIVLVDGLSRPAIMDGYFYFRANDSVHGYELWRSDGTEAGTTLVKDINESPYVANVSGSSDPWFFTVADGTLLFTANDGIHGRELWKSDGTEGGTELVKDINPGTDTYPYPLWLTEASGTLYFAADEGTNGMELWKSDGTEAGTVMVKDINPGSDSTPNYFTSFRGEVYFQADDGTIGSELWKTDGTVGSAALVADLNPGGESSWPGDFLVMNDTLFFGATYKTGDKNDYEALFRYGAPLPDEFFWPLFLPNIMYNIQGSRK